MFQTVKCASIRAARRTNWEHVYYGQPAGEKAEIAVYQAEEPNLNFTHISALAKLI